MAYVSGKPERCSQCGALFGPQATIREWWDRIDRVFVGELACPACDTLFLYTRGPTKTEGVLMAKRASKPTSTKKRDSKQGANAPKAETAPTSSGPTGVVHRVTTFGKGSNPPSGSTEVAPADAGPGPLELPSGDEATTALAEIAQLNDRVSAAHTAFKASAEVTKDKREKWQQLSEELQALIRKWTHKPAMPLFDAAEREADQGRLLKAVESVTESAPEGASADAEGPQDATSAAEATETVGGETIEAPAAPEPPALPNVAPADTVVF